MKGGFLKVSPNSLASELGQPAKQAFKFQAKFRKQVKTKPQKKQKKKQKKQSKPKVDIPEPNLMEIKKEIEANPYPQAIIDPTIDSQDKSVRQEGFAANLVPEPTKEAEIGTRPQRESKKRARELMTQSIQQLEDIPKKSKRRKPSSTSARAQSNQTLALLRCDETMDIAGSQESMLLTPQAEAVRKAIGYIEPPTWIDLVQSEMELGGGNMVDETSSEELLSSVLPNLPSHTIPILIASVDLPAFQSLAVHSSSSEYSSHSYAEHTPSPYGDYSAELPDDRTSPTTSTPDYYLGPPAESNSPEVPWAMSYHTPPTSVRNKRFSIHKPQLTFIKGNSYQARPLGPEYYYSPVLVDFVQALPAGQHVDSYQVQVETVQPHYYHYSEPAPTQPTFAPLVGYY